MRAQLLLIALICTAQAVIISEKPTEKVTQKKKIPKKQVKKEEEKKSCEEFLDDREVFTVCEHETHKGEFTIFPPWAPKEKPEEIEEADKESGKDEKKGEGKKN